MLDFRNLNVLFVNFRNLNFILNTVKFELQEHVTRFLNLKNELFFIEIYQFRAECIFEMSVPKLNSKKKTFKFIKKKLIFYSKILLMATFHHIQLTFYS